MSSFSIGQAAARGFRAVCSPPLSSTLTQIINMLDTAAEQMMVHKDFHAVFDTCDRGLESLSSMESEDNRCSELKAGFCILGIQALAELNRWQGVLSWVLQQYEQQETLPAKIMQMCVLLYSKVGKPAVIQDAARVWLHCPSNRGVAGFGTVAELYLLHVLVPLGHSEEARELITGQVGGAVFTEDQRQTALDVVEEREQQSQDPPVKPDAEVTAHPVSSQGCIIHRLKAMLRFLHRKFSMTGFGSFPLRKLFLAAVLLYMLLVRLDPALPSSFLWISKLLQLLRQMDCSVGMRGLPNYHLSCCVNTLLQTLSATWEVAALLEKWEAAGLRGDDRNVPLQLKRVLADMRGTQPQHAPHRDFLHCLHRNCIRLSTQHDANEVFLFILSFIQQQIDDKPLALEIQNLYKISMETQLQCLECNNIQSKGSYLLSLPLHIKEDHNSLEGCMASFFQHQELSGINCCFCQCCETKRPSRQGVRLRSLPRILCMQLKRFRNTLGSTRKLDCRVTFPETFDFSEVVPEALCRDFVQDNCSYTLYAVVVHSGTAMCGHYTAYVCVKERWYHADDSHVQLASWEEVQTTFGERYGRTAYILMYRRGSREEGHRRSDLSG